MNKPKIYIDLDGCVFNTIKCICDLYNEDFKYYESFKEVNWWEVESWDFHELTAANKDHINTYFNQPRFFECVEFMDWVAPIAILKLARDFDVVFVSAGYSPNLKLKEEWIADNFLFADFIGVDLREYEDKSHVDMSDGVFIDDCAMNLETSNARFKICFGDLYEWNEEWDGVRCYNWNDVLRLFGIETE